MSLINDALKKAQKQQTQQPATQSAPGALPHPARAAGPSNAVMSFERMLLLVVTLVVVIVGATAVAVLLARKGDRPATAAVERQPAPAPAVSAARVQARPETPAPPPVVPAILPKPGPETSAAAALPVDRAAVSAPAPVPKPVAVPSIEIPTVSLSPAAATPQPAAPPEVAAPAVSVNLASTRAAGPGNSVSAAPTPPPARPASPPPPAGPTKHERILSFIENARVAGVRVAGDDSKVLLNDHVYRLNNMVSLELGLRLTAVATGTLTFVDEDGAVYSKAY